MGSIIHDQTYLAEEQYKTSANLDARTRLYQTYNKNKMSWYAWVFDQLEIGEGQRILEVGCGPAGLWKENIVKTRDLKPVILSDFSVGMLKQARFNLAEGRVFRFANFDVQNLPFESGQFDIVIANHMLYHVPSITRAAAEIVRVLKAGGKLVAATNGKGHNQEIINLIAAVRPDFKNTNDAAKRFGLENASVILQPYFKSINVCPRPDNLWVTESEPLINYIKSTWVFESGRREGDLEKIEEIINSEIKQKGGYYVHQVSGLVIAVK